MIPQTPLDFSRWLLAILGTEVAIHHPTRLPQTPHVLVVSNHRSALDAPLLMMATQRSIRFACHHYMSQVPGLRELVASLGCVPIDGLQQREKTFFPRAIQLLQDKEMVGIFPEGARPMIEVPQMGHFNAFHRGFAHLALRVPVPELAVLPVAIAPLAETQTPVAPLQLFQWFDPSEPLFQGEGWHPVVVYQRVTVKFGQPIWITAKHRQHYQGKQAGLITKALTHACTQEIANLLPTANGSAPKTAPPLDAASNPFHGMFSP